MGTIVLALERDFESAVGNEVAPNLALKKRKEQVNEKLTRHVCDDPQFKDMRILNVVPSALFKGDNIKTKAATFRRYVKTG